MAGALNRKLFSALEAKWPYLGNSVAVRGEFSWPLTVGVSSLVITSQLPLSSWYQAIEERTVADGVLDRLVHNSIKVELFG